MFCEKCGQANPDGATICESCGEELTQATANTSANEAAAPTEDFGYTAPAAPANPIEKFMPMIIGAGAIVLVLILLLAFGVFKSGSLKAVEKLNKAIVKADGKAQFELTVDPHKLEKAIENEEYEDKNDAIEQYKENAEDTKDFLDNAYGKGLKIKTEKKKITKYKKDEVKAINAYLEEVHEYPADYVSALHLVKVKETVKGKDEETTNTSDYVVAKIKGKWYVNNLPGVNADNIKDVIKEYK